MNINDSDIFKTQRIQLPIAGRIAAGAQRLTAAAAKSIPKAKEAFARGEDSGASYEDIERYLLSKAPESWGKKKPLVPTNTPYFRVCGQDFVNRENATAVMKYAEVRDEGAGLQLYSFPVIFPVDSVDDVLHQGFSCYSGRKIKYWRDDDGRCVELPEPEKGRRKFGVRSPVERKPVCDPDECDEFNAKQCNHSADLYFYVPGMAGTGVLRLSFRSIYAATGIISVLETTRRALGRISGVFGGQPMFWLSKREQRVNQIDWNKGTVSQVTQQIIMLEARGIDMTQWFIAQEGEDTARLAAPESPVLMAVDDYPEHLDKIRGAKTRAPIEPNGPRIDADNSDKGKVVAADESDQKPAQKQEPRHNDRQREAEAKAGEPTTREGKNDVTTGAKDNFVARLKKLKVTKEQFESWAHRNYGEEAFSSVDATRAIEKHVGHAETTKDVSTFVGKVIPTQEEAPF